MNADVLSGSLDLSYGRTAGEMVYSGFTSSNNITSGIGDLSMYFRGVIASDSPHDTANASFSVMIWNDSNAYANFNQPFVRIHTAPNEYATSGLDVAHMVDAGAFWQSSSNSTHNLDNRIFWAFTYYSAASATDYRIWTNPDAIGTKYVMFHLDGDGDDTAWGWLQFDWTITDSDNWSVTLSNWAYSTDGPLAAGATGTPAVPGLGGLAALAVGAAGVRGRRQRSAG